MNMQDRTMGGAISALESRIEGTEAAHVYLCRKARDLEILLLQLKRERNALKNQVAPVSSLPNELLVAVFEVLAFDASLRHPHIEIVLSHVNRRFRNIAIDTRMLWTLVTISRYTQFDMVITYLQRSGLSPFELRFDVGGCSDSDSTLGSEIDDDVCLYSESEWKEIMSHIPRCRLFSARAVDPIFIYELTERLRAVKAPLLRSFRLECTSPYAEPYPASHFSIIDGGAPALTSVWMNGWGLYQCLPPLANVTSLTLLQATQWMSWGEFRNIIGGCLALMYLVAGEIFEEEDGGLPNGFESTIVLPSLKSLYICVSESATCDVLVAVSAPRLEFLTLDQIQLGDVVQISFLHHLGDESACIY
jgi:hypothetical protein